MSSVERYYAPRTLEEAAAILSGGGVTILAGGTDLMPQTQSGKVQFQSALMNVRRIDAIRGIEAADGAIRIGALTTITELLENALVRERLPVLVEAADHFASDQLRNAATLGGNVCNASPAGDFLPPLLALDAEVELVSRPDGSMKTRTLPLAGFFTGPGRTKRAPGELLAAVRIPMPAPGFAARFFKFGTRPALDISAIAIALGGVRSGNSLTGVRVAFGSVAPVPMRAPRTEAAIEGARLDAANIAAAATVAQEEINPISDVRASAWYRKEMIHNVMRRMLTDVAAA